LPSGGAIVKGIADVQDDVQDVEEAEADGDLS
jgi:hypothetical protein